METYDGQGFPFSPLQCRQGMDSDAGVGGTKEMCTMHAGVMLCIVFVTMLPDMVDDSSTSTICLYLSPSQLCLLKRIRTSYARAHAHTRPRAYACGRAIASRSSTQTMQGGREKTQRGGGGWGCPCRLCPTCEERLRRVPLLTVLGTHRISRSFPLPPQLMLARSPDPTPHAHIALCFNHEANRGPLPAPALRAPILHARVPAHSLPVPPSALACGACMRRMLVAGDTL